MSEGSVQSQSRFHCCAGEEAEDRVRNMCIASAVEQRMAAGQWSSMSRLLTHTRTRNPQESKRLTNARARLVGWHHAVAAEVRRERAEAKVGPDRGHAALNAGHVGPIAECIGGVVGRRGRPRGQGAVWGRGELEDIGRGGVGFVGEEGLGKILIWIVQVLLIGVRVQWGAKGVDESRVEGALREEAVKRHVDGEEV